MEKYFEFRYTLETVSMVIGLGFCVLFAIVAITVVVGEKVYDRRLRKRLAKKYPTKK